MSLGADWAKRIIVVEVVALLAALAVPSVRGSARHGAAQRAAQAVDVVCTAADRARARTGAWPQDEAPGVTPDALKPFLPAGFRFATSTYNLDWDHWSLSEGPDYDAATSQFQGVVITTNDPRMLDDVVAAMGRKRPHFTVGDRVTVEIPDDGPRAP